jgi:hypothetical protein
MVIPTIIPIIQMLKVVNLNIYIIIFRMKKGFSHLIIAIYIQEPDILNVMRTNHILLSAKNNNNSQIKF